MKLIILIMSMILPTLKHPISVGTMLILQTTMISMISSSKFNSPWYSYILFITMIGGLMIMFMYMSSIASNEKFKSMNFKMILFILILSITLNMMMNLYLENNEKMEEYKFNSIEFEELKSTNKFFNFNKSKLTILMILILLITMISVTNISSSMEGPLKKTYV
nr:NADH dehydrogenase subunit 6 [Peltonotellus sp.]